MKRVIFSMAMVMGLLAATAGCGGGGGMSGSALETTTACTAYCNAYLAKNCAQAMYTDLNDCMTNDCGVIKEIPDRCQAKLKAYYDCRKAQPDLCADSGCGSQLSAAGTCM